MIIEYYNATINYHKKINLYNGDTTEPNEYIKMFGDFINVMFIILMIMIFMLSSVLTLYIMYRIMYNICCYNIRITPFDNVNEYVNEYDNEYDVGYEEHNIFDIRIDN